MNKLIVVTGQTATGKTSLAVELAKKQNGELINCDSRQIYRELDIVTGKDRSIIKNVPVWLYDIVDPHEHFSSQEYVDQAKGVIEKITFRDKLPILVGGTYFYIKHLLYGIETKIEPNWFLRRKLDKKTVLELQKILRSLDPNAMVGMNESDRKNPRRLMRRIEIAMSQRGKVAKVEKSTFPHSHISTFPRYNVQIIGLRFKNKEKLRQAIESRVAERIKEGAIEEIRRLVKHGYDVNSPGLKAIGCAQIMEFLAGKIDEKELVKKWTTKEMQYAKRQYIFMKKDKNIKWKEI